MREPPADAAADAAASFEIVLGVAPAGQREQRGDIECGVREHCHVGGGAVLGEGEPLARELERADARGVAGVEGGAAPEAVSAAAALQAASLVPAEAVLPFVQKRLHHLALSAPLELQGGAVHGLVDMFRAVGVGGGVGRVTVNVSIFYRVMTPDVVQARAGHLLFQQPSGQVPPAALLIPLQPVREGGV